MVNVLVLPVSGLLEFNNAAVGTSTPVTSTSSAIRVSLATSSALLLSGIATTSERLIIAGTNGSSTIFRDVSATTGTTASLTTRTLSAANISSTSAYFGTVSATTLIGGVALSSLTDTNISATPTTGYVLKWNGTKWAPAVDETGGGGGATELAGLTDIDATSLPSQGATYATGGGVFYYDNDNSIWRGDDIPTYLGKSPVRDAWLSGLGISNYERSFRNTSNQNVTSTSFVACTNLSAALAANDTYDFHYLVPISASTGTMGVDISLSGNVTATNLYYTMVYWTSDTLIAERGATAYGFNAGSLNSNGTNIRLYEVYGTIVVGASATTIYPVVKKENVTGTFNVMANSIGKWKKV